ncbi:MAG: metal ABC transporter permease [Bacteriovoracaceae bacterium]
MEFLALQDFIQYDFLFLALLSVIFLSLSSALLSPLVVSNGLSFYSSALSHSCFFGLGLVYFFAIEPSQMIITGVVLAFSLLFGQVLAFGTYHNKLPPDSLIGLFFTGTMGAGVLLLEASKQTSETITSFLFGNILLVENTLVFLLFGLLIIGSGVLYYYRKALLMWSWNSELSKAILPNASFINSLIYFLVSLNLVFGLQVAGILPMSSLLIVPGMFSTLYGTNLKNQFFCSIIFSFLTSLSSLVLANFIDLSFGPTVATVQVLAFLITLIFKKIRK